MDINMDKLMRLLANLIVVGYVSSVDETNGTARVMFPSHDNKVSAPLFVLTRGSKDVKDYWLPAVDDQVLCLYAPNYGGKGIGAGYIVGTIYSSKDRPPAGGPRVLDVPGNLTIRCGSLDIQAKSGDVVANGISLVHHTHGGVTPGGGKTGTPE